MYIACAQGVPHSIQQSGHARYPLEESPRSSAQLCLSLCVVTASLPHKKATRQPSLHSAARSPPENQRLPSRTPLKEHALEPCLVKRMHGEAQI